MVELADKPIPIAMEQRFMAQAAELDRVYESLLELQPIAMIDARWHREWLAWMRQTDALRDEIKPALEQGKTMVAGLGYIWYGVAAVGAWLAHMFLQQTEGAVMNNKLAYARELKRQGYSNEQSVDLANKLFGGMGVSWVTIALTVGALALFFRK